MNRLPQLISNLPDHASIAVQRARDPERVTPSTDHAVVHPHSGIGLYLSGTARFWMGREYLLQAGDVVMVPEGMPHFARDAVGVQQIGIAFCPHCVRGRWGDDLRELFTSVRSGGSAVRRMGDRVTEVIRLIDRVGEELEEDRAGSGRMIDGLMLQLVVELERAGAASGTTAPGEGASVVVMSALDFIERRAAEAISLSDVAAAVGRSPAHLATVVKEETGQTVVEWITSARMALARNLLTTTDETIATIADDIGYASASHFHRTFRRAHSATPGAWRSAHRS